MLRLFTSRVQRKYMPAAGSYFTPMGRYGQRRYMQQLDWRSLYPHVDPKLVSESIQSIAAAQMDSVKKVVPWYLENMPAHYFLNVSEPLRLQQLQAMAVLNHFQQDGMSIKLEAAGATKRRWSFVSAGSGSQLLERELNRLLGSDHAVGHGTRPIEQLINVKVYNSADKQISVVIFTFALQPAGAGAAWGVVHKTIQERQEREDRELPSPGVVLSVTDVEAILSTYAPEQTPVHAKQRTSDFLYAAVAQSETEQTAVLVSPINATSAWLNKASVDNSPQRVLRDTVHYLRARGYGIDQVMVDCVELVGALPSHSPHYVVMTRVSFRHNGLLPEGLQQLGRDIQRLKWLSTDIIELGMVQCPFLGLQRAEIILALCALMQGQLSARNPGSFLNADAVAGALQVQLQKGGSGDSNAMRLAARVADMFLLKFAPGSSSSRQTSGFGQASYPTRSEIEEELAVAGAAGAEDDDLGTLDAVMVLRRMLGLLDSCTASNLGNTDRGALAFAVCPAAVEGAHDCTSPNARAVFVYGLGFVGFHCRLATTGSWRGDYQLIVPTSKEDRSSIAAGLFAAAWRAADTFDVLSKDLPARGAANVVLLDKAPTHSEREDTGRRAFRAFWEAVMDLDLGPLTPSELRCSMSQTLLSMQSNCDMPNQSWIRLRWNQRAGRVAGSGIGASATDTALVTAAAVVAAALPASLAQLQRMCSSMLCEGLVMHLSAAAKMVLGIDPASERFTLKLFGDEPALKLGDLPGTDVVGCNPCYLLPIIFREFGSNCVVVALAIGDTFLSDPNGLDNDELQRLFNRGLPLASFDPSRLGHEGVMLTEGVDEAMVAIVPVVADVCVPCPGSSFNIDDRNWRSMLRHCTQLPRTRLLIEGAPGIVSPTAVQLLHRWGVCVLPHIVFAKGALLARELIYMAPECGIHWTGRSDSEDHAAVDAGGEFTQANISASVPIPPERLEQIAAFVRERVRCVATLEADLVFSEHSKSHPYSQAMLSEIATRAAVQINRLKAILSVRLAQPGPTSKQLTQVGMKFVQLHWFETGTPDDENSLCVLPTPLSFRRDLIGATLAALYVYREGLRAVEGIPDDVLYQSLCAYFTHYDHIRTVIQQLESADGAGTDSLPASSLNEGQREQLCAFLDKGGAGAAVRRDSM